MNLIDLTLPIPDSDPSRIALEEMRIGPEPEGYTGLIYHFHHNSMVGSYLDLPGHIKETDDGRDAANYPLDQLYRVPAAVIHLNRESGSGGVSAAELAAACPPGLHSFPALVLNALGPCRFDEIECRSVWLELDAVQWLIDAGVRLLVADIYESPRIHGVFLHLFRAGVATVCLPVNLALLIRPQVRITVLMPRYLGVTQIPCRILAEME